MCQRGHPDGAQPQSPVVLDESGHLSELTMPHAHARDLRLVYVPSVVRDKEGRERHHIFLLWLAPGVQVRNPFLP